MLPADREELGERHGTDSSSEETNPADIVILDFPSPELQGSDFLLFKHPVCGAFVIAALWN